MIVKRQKVINMNLEKAKQAYKENPMLREILKEFFTLHFNLQCFTPTII